MPSLPTQEYRGMLHRRDEAVQARCSPCYILMMSTPQVLILFFPLGPLLGKKYSKQRTPRSVPPHTALEGQSSISEKGHLWRTLKAEELSPRAVMQWFAQKDGFLQSLFRYINIVETQNYKPEIHSTNVFTLSILIAGTAVIEAVAFP